MSDTEAVPPSTRTAPLQSMPSRFQVRDDAIAHVVAAAAERAGEGDAPAEPRDRDRGIGRAAAAGDDEFGGMHFGAGRGKFSTRMTMSCTAMPAHKILGALLPGALQSKPISSSTQARMM